MAKKVTKRRRKQYLPLDNQIRDAEIAVSVYSGLLTLRMKELTELRQKQWIDVCNCIQALTVNEPELFQRVSKMLWDSGK